MNDFENELRNNIALRAVGESEFQLYAFADELAERLEAAEVVFDVAIEPLRCTGRRGRVLEILGYAEDHADDSLVVIVGLHYDEPGRVLTMTDAKRIFASGASFLEHAADGWLTENLEPSSREAEHASYFAQQSNRVDRLKFILVTDGTMSQRIKTIPTNQVCRKRRRTQSGMFVGLRNFRSPKAAVTSLKLISRDGYQTVCPVSWERRVVSTPRAIWPFCRASC